MANNNSIIEILFERFSDIRYVATYINKDLHFRQRENISNSSSSESDKYEELIVNPTLLTLARQRGNIDCGGLNYIVISYGNFNQIIMEINSGHISICLDKGADLTKNLQLILDLVKTHF